MKSLIHFTITAMTALLLSSCMGGLVNRVNMTYNRHITIGQELMDLQKAHEAGVLTNEEYEEAKETVLKSVSEYEKFHTDKKENKK